MLRAIKLLRLREKLEHSPSAGFLLLHLNNVYEPDETWKEQDSSLASIRQPVVMRLGAIIETVGPVFDANVHFFFLVFTSLIILRPRRDCSCLIAVLAIRERCLSRRVLLH